MKCTKGRNVMKGYYNKPEKLLKTIDSEGWIHTGDLGEIRGDGFLYVTGRKRDDSFIKWKNINQLR